VTGTNGENKTKNLMQNYFLLYLLLVAKREVFKLHQKF